jgi:hypothetical protein
VLPPPSSNSFFEKTTRGFAITDSLSITSSEAVTRLITIYGLDVSADQVTIAQFSGCADKHLDKAAGHPFSAWHALNRAKKEKCPELQLVDSGARLESFLFCDPCVAEWLASPMRLAVVFYGIVNMEVTYRAF